MDYLLDKVVGVYLAKANLGISPRRALSILSQFKAIHYNIGNQSLVATTALQEHMTHILQAAKIPIPEKMIKSHLVT